MTTKKLKITGGRLSPSQKQALARAHSQVQHATQKLQRIAEEIQQATQSKP